MNDTPPPLPEKISRYEIRSEIGRGGMASVYLAYDPNFGREVAIKILPRELMHDPTFRARFHREARTIAALEHPSIVPVYDFGEGDGQPYLVMRYLSGGSLVSRIRSGPIPAAEASVILSRIGSALDAAHAKGIVHRDLKPANILFDQYGNAYLSDFGIAHLSDTAGTLTGSMVIGTPAYMSPEQISGEKKVDGRSDIYALGIVVFEMLTGQAPFQSDSPLKVMMMHVSNPPPKLSEADSQLPAGSSAVLERALAKEPDKRYQKAAEFSRAFDEVTGGRKPTAAVAVTEGVDRRAGTGDFPPKPAAAPPPPPASGAAAPAGRRRFSPWAAIAGIFACLCLTVGGGAAFLNTDFGKWLFRPPDQLSPTAASTVTAAPTDAPAPSETLTPTAEEITPAASAVPYVSGQPFLLSNGQPYSTMPHIGVDSEGIAHVFWLDETDEDLKILLHRMFTPDGKWTEPDCVSCHLEAPVSSYGYHFASQPGGKVCVGFTYLSPDVRRVGYIACYRGSGAPETRQITLQNESIEGNDFLLELDPSGSAISPLLGYNTVQVGSTLIADGSLGMNSTAFAVDSKTGYHLCWVRAADTPAAICRYSANQGTTWSATQAVIQDTGSAYAALILYPGKDGSVYLLEDDYDATRTLVWNGSWSPAHPLRTDFILWTLDFVTDNDGTVYLLGTGYFSGEYGIWLFKEDPDQAGAWTGPVSIRSLEDVAINGFSAAVAENGKLLLTFVAPGRDSSLGDILFVEAPHI
ncbi:MAG: serine/threonine protein kinase [Anaerolineales bacterium]|nr:serine/threonine protein kinase [Anaerolineales bacterium]